MAERLKRYRPLGVSIPTVPTVDYVATGRAQARAMAPIQRGLDSMTDFALKKFEEKALIEGAEYGAQNAPTKQQLQDAQGDIEDLVPGDQTTVFGRAARKAALQSMTTNFEMSAREQMVNLRIQAQQENMDTATFTEQSNAIIDGYTSTLQDISPAAALNFRATMATVGNSALLSHSNKLLEEQRRQDKVTASDNVDLIINGRPDDMYFGSLSDIFEQGSTAKSATQDYVSMVEKIEMQRLSVIDMATEIGDPAFLSSKLKAFDEKVDELYGTSTSGWLNQAPAERLHQLSTGKITDTRFADIWSNMTTDQQQKSSLYARQQLRDIEATNTSLSQAAERKRTKTSESLLVTIADKRLKNEDYAEDLQQLKTIDGSAWIDISSQIRSDGAIDDPSTVANLNLASVDGMLTMDMVRGAYSRGNLSNPTFSNMLDKVKSGRNEAHREAMTFVKNSLLPDVAVADLTILSDDSDTKRLARQVADIENRLIQAVKVNPDLNRFDFVQPLVKAFQVTEEDVLAKKTASAQSRFDSLVTQGLIPKDATPQDAIDFVNSQDYTQTQKDSLNDGYKLLMD